MHLLHLLAHRLHLLLRGLKCRIVIVSQQFRVDGLGKPLAHLLSAWPVHVLDEQVTRHAPQLRVALQQLAHGIQRLLALGHVARASRHAHIVLANAKVVDFLDHNACLVDDLAHRLRLIRVDHRRIRLPIDADDAGNALGVVDFWDQIHNLPSGVPNRPRQIVDVVVGACVALFFTRQDRSARAFVARSAQTGVILAGSALDVIRSARLGL